MGLHIESEQIAVTGYDAAEMVWFTLAPLSEELHQAANDQAEQFVIEHREAIRKAMRESAYDRPIRFSWWKWEQNREEIERFKVREAERQGFEQEPPVIPSRERSYFLDRALHMIDRDELEKLRIIVGSEHARDLGSYFAGMADREDNEIVKTKKLLENIFPLLKKDFPDLTLEQFLVDHMTAPSSFFMEEAQTAKNPKKPIYGLFDAEAQAAYIRISQTKRDHYLGYVTLLADHLTERVK